MGVGGMSYILHVCIAHLRVNVDHANASVSAPGGGGGGGVLLDQEYK